MEVRTLVSALFFVVLLTGCGGDKYDQLIVVDGNGQKYVLRHNIGDNYFINKIPDDSTNSYISEANSKIIK